MDRLGEHITSSVPQGRKGVAFVLWWGILERFVEKKISFRALPDLN
jgi:hypothetical protein